MKLGDCRFPADENIDPAVVVELRRRGSDAQTVAERGLAGKPDDQILAVATPESRVVITHDRDFGTLAVAQRVRIFGIVYLRPGHISTGFTLGTLDVALREAPDLRSPFILVAVRAGDDVSIRVRFLEVDGTSSQPLGG